MSANDPALLRSPLHEWHIKHGARMVPFGGWCMPLHYTSIIHEHRTTRSAVGIADISHMGRLRFEGPGAAVFLAELTTRRVADMVLNQIRYSFVTNEEGGILDDVLVGYYHDAYGQPFYVMVVNAANRTKIVDWVHRHLPPERAERPGHEVLFADVTALWAMFAVQGPRAVEVLQPLVDVDLHDMKYYHGAQVRILHPAAERQGGIISRTGYTGEDGFELSIGVGIAQGVWEAILDLGEPLGMVPTGIGARDTLRLEAGMPLYGHELSEDVNPFEAGLGFACHLVGYDFPGRDALKRIQSQPLGRVLVGIELDGRRPAREGCTILADGRPIGRVTSGTYSPTLQKPIAMGYVRPEYARPGTSLRVDVRGHLEAARVVRLPFYSRKRKGKSQ
ncbi:MAG TPA: glycine cleavage system aminomethyltransferase GcvT [Planctomycetaceae bacterium]|nr:glycine cleavage system aminomethyltransferase GcvT [Planctomycetaceae bacterium]